MRWLLALLLLCGPAWADNMEVMGVADSGISVPYVGPGDIVSGASAYWGTRAYTQAYAVAHGKIANLRRNSDGALFDILSLANGTPDQASAEAFAGTDATCAGTISGTTLTVSSCSSGTIGNYDIVTGTNVPWGTVVFPGGCQTPPGACTLNQAATVGSSETMTFTGALFVNVAYDQTGNGNDASNSAPLSQPYFLPYCQNYKPCMVYDINSTSGGSLTTTATFSVAQPYTIMASAFSIGGTSYQEITRASSSLTYIRFHASATSVDQYAGTQAIITGVAYSVLHAFNGVFNNTSSILNIDGTDNATSVGTGAYSGVAYLGNDFGENLYGNLNEVGLWPVAFSSGQRANMCANQASHIYGWALSVCGGP